jgi:hypothetical protein
MKTVEITVYRNRFSSAEKKVGVVRFNGQAFDYADLEVGEVAECKSVLEKPQREYVGFKNGDGYGKHSVQIVERDPFTIEHLASISNRRLENGLFFEVDFAELLAFRDIEQK